MIEYNSTKPINVHDWRCKHGHTVTELERHANVCISECLHC